MERKEKIKRTRSAGAGRPAKFDFNSLNDPGGLVVFKVEVSENSKYKAIQVSNCLRLWKKRKNHTFMTAVRNHGDKIHVSRLN
jgi:hypothetical protein